MNAHIHTLRLCCKRDLVLVRQHARQIAAMLEFSPHEQMWISAAVFELAQATCRGKRRAGIRFRVTNNSLHVFPLRTACRFGRITVLRRNRRSPLRLVVHLPHETTSARLADVAWAMKQLTELTPADLFEELQVQNQEFLRTCQQLRASQEELELLYQQLHKPAAA